MDGFEHTTDWPLNRLGREKVLGSDVWVSAEILAGRGREDDFIRVSSLPLKTEKPGAAS